jgi:glycine dehydrogenase subunit 1
MTAAHPYIPNTDEDRRQMLDAIGVPTVDELFSDIPPAFKIGSLDLPPALSEFELAREMSDLAHRNVVAGNGTASFLGGGAYQHFIPSIVGHIIGRSEYYTAYTPYQPEISQGTLQTMFELQSMTCELMGMDVANAGMYDGASALAEACLMACRVTGRTRVAVHESVNPAWLDVIRTYAFGPELAVDVVADGNVTSEHACLAVQQPAFLGHLEDVWTLGKAARGAEALYVVAADPISLGMLTPPGEYGADIAVAEGQSLGWPVNFGGPWLGLLTCREAYVRQMPGRIVGRTTDMDGRTGYVLTLQTRGNHPRRDINICTSQQLVGLAATVPDDVGKPACEIAESCYHKAHYAANIIHALPGYSVDTNRPFFNEFVVKCPRPVTEINAGLLERQIIGGLDVSGRMLMCVTEMNTREEIERLRDALAELGR